MSFNPVFTPTWSDVERYKRLRALGKDLNHRMLDDLPRKAIFAVGQALGILHQDVLVFGAESTMGVLMDSSLYDWPVVGKNTVQRYAETHTFAPGSDDHELMQASLRAEYRLLAPQAVREGVGVYFDDVFSGEQFFVMDIGLSQGQIDPEVAFASRIIPLGGYWMTGGAGLPLMPEVRKAVTRRLLSAGILVDGNITNRRRLARIAVRACLKAGAAEHVMYQDLQENDREMGR